ncbi:cytochrome c oxidase assembly protein [Nocardioides sp.]|uniref:cytochrome c oxidase assembly protein n=1 Tax=Nocardioides sp. TaxID=35761 RepID=UPI003515C05A
MSVDQQQETAPAPEPAGAGVRRDPVVALVAVATSAAAAVLLLALGGGGPQEPIAGLPDPGPVVGWGLPAVRLAADLLAVAVIGGLLVTPLTMRRIGDEVGASAFRGLRSVRLLALGWFVAVLAQIVLTYSDQFAVPLSQVGWTELRGFLTTADQAKSLLVQAGLVLALVVVSRWVLLTRSVLALLVLALAAVVPPLLTGHAAGAGNHDTAVIGVVVHVIAAVIWVGGVVALWWHLALSRKMRERALHRFSGIASWCLAAVVISGVIGTLVRTGGVDGLASAYGAAAGVKLVLVTLVGLVALQLRRRVIAAPVQDAALLLRLTGLEVIVMATAIGLGVALSRTPPPVPDSLYPTAAQSLIGGAVPPEPTLGRLLFSFTPSGLGMLVVLLGSAAYIAGLRTLRRRGDAWPVGRTVLWFAGILVVAYATMGGLGVYAKVAFSAHMASHMALSMVAPIFLVSGRPIQLALRALPGSDVPGGTGPRQLLAGVLDSRVAKVFMNPVTASLLLIGSLWVVYLSDGLFDALMRNHLGHVAMEVHFLLAGLLFFEVLIGEGPGHRLTYVGRLLMLLVSMPFHAFFSVTVMGSDRIIGEQYYRLLDVPWIDSLLDDQNLAGAMNWALGEVPMVMVIIVLLLQWWRSDQREARRRDRAADRDGDAELNAYNAMLGQIAEGKADVHSGRGYQER